MQGYFGKLRAVNFDFGWDQSQKKRWFHQFARMWNIPILLMGFLLGRAMILGSIAPFAVAYFAAIYHLARRQWPVVMIALILGAATLGASHALQTMGFLFFFLLIQKCFQLFGKDQINFAPLAVLIGCIGGHLLKIGYLGLTPHQGILSSVEILLSVILTYVFIYALPLFTVKKKRFFIRNEELICLILLLGSAITGLSAWELGSISVVHIVTRYVVLLLAFLGGAMLGAAMGVVTGMIICLSDLTAMMQLSLLAFSGLLAGLFKEGKQWVVAAVFLLGATILSLYESQTATIVTSVYETLLAIGLFFLTPKSFQKSIARLIPGTSENQSLHQEYVRKLRNVVATKVESFVELFHELANSFRDDTGKRKREDQDHLHQSIEQVMRKTCKGCRRYQMCWGQNMMFTYRGMTDLMAWVEMKGVRKTFEAPEFWKRYCIRPESVLHQIKSQYQWQEQQAFWKNKVRESKRLVYSQLMGMTSVMERLATEIRHETRVISAQEESIHQALEELGLSVGRVNVINLEEGKVEIEVEMNHPDALDECKKLVAPLLTEVLGEPITVFRKMVQDRSQSSIVTIGSAQKYVCKTGVASAAKGGGFISGDSYCYMNLGTGRYAVAISDGMGNGQRAQAESSAALKLIRRLLQAGMKEETAVETVNSILSLRSADEMFATIDLAMVDLNSAVGRFMKIGSTPGFIKRGKEILMISAANPPIGILDQIDIEPIEMALEPGDLVIMFTDGIYDAPRHIANKDALMKRLISEIQTKDPQDFADCLLEKVVRNHHGKIKDDMTVVVFKIEHYTPEWATIRMPGIKRLERSQAAIS